MTSTRLPGKVLRPLGGRSVLGWVVRAAAVAPGVARVVVATSTTTGDDPVAAEADRLGVDVVRGSLDDVLDRFGVATARFPCAAVVRLTADCPLADPALIGQVVAAWRADPTLDYVSTTLVRTLPRGMDVSVVRAGALAEQVAVATGVDRVHVTSGLYANPEKYRCAGVVVRPDASDLRVTLDTEADAVLLDGLVAELGDRPPSWREVVALLRARPDLVARNAHVRQKPVAAG